MMQTTKTVALAVTVAIWILALARAASAQDCAVAEATLANLEANITSTRGGVVLLHAQYVELQKAVMADLQTLMTQPTECLTADRKARLADVQRGFSAVDHYTAAESKAVKRAAKRELARQVSVHVSCTSGVATDCTISR